MSEYMNNEGYELGWDSQIENEGTPFVVAEPGDYNFTVVNMERARFNGSAKMPPCNQAKLTLRMAMPDGSICDVKHNLFLHTKTEWKLSEFFLSIGQKQKGQKLVPNWNNLIGATGRCKVTKRSFKNKDGRDMETNDIERFYEPEQHGSDLPYTVPANYPQMPQQPQQAVNPQPGYQAPQQGYAQQSFGGYTPGKF